ncbi:MAG: DUF120 domain-containing protein [Thermoplasmata archaeon]|nr:DUF120 domain-containing protein [Thermoplasmata archaeon]
MTAHGRRPKVKGEELELLKLLAAAKASQGPVVVTSRDLGEKLGVSQQAADRYLLSLEAGGLITRSLAARRQKVQLSDAAMETLRQEYHGYRRLFEGPGSCRFAGAVASGLGEGRYYLSQPGYVIQFASKLGYEPYPGTLNVRVGEKEMQRVGAVRHWNGIRIDGFESGGRTFGGASCYPAKLRSALGHLIIPDRTHHRDVVELIAPERLRDSLSLKDGDVVDVDVEET